MKLFYQIIVRMFFSTSSYFVWIQFMLNANVFLFAASRCCRMRACLLCVWVCIRAPMQTANRPGVERMCVCVCAHVKRICCLHYSLLLFYILYYFLFFIHYGCFNCFGAVAVLAVVAPGFNVCLCYCSSCLVSHLVARHVRTAAAAATADQHPATFLLCGANGNGTSASVAILQLALSAYAMERIQRGENNCKEERKKTTKIAIQSDNNKSNSSSSHKQNTRRGKLFYLLNAVGMVDACCCFRWGAHSLRNVRTIRVWRIERLNAIGWIVGQKVPF